MSSKVTKKDLSKVFWRSHMIQGSWNYEGQMNLGYLYAMMPVLRRLYNDKKDLSKAMERQMGLFNCTPQTSTFIMGLNAAMEEEASENNNFPSESINAIKTSLMGPLAGIGDSFFWGTFKVIAAGIGIGFASKGSIIGPIASLIVYNIPSVLVRYFGLKIGYKTGSSFLEKIADGGLMEKVTHVASIVGLMVVGAMVASMINLSFDLSISTSGDPITLQGILDSFLPKATPLLATGVMYYFIRKGLSSTKLLLSIVLFGILSAWLGIFTV